MTHVGTDLFAPGQFTPEGFAYHADIVSPAEERDLIRQIATLPLTAFEFEGFKAKRKALSFGWQYDFNQKEFQRATDIPKFLHPLRKCAAHVAHVHPTELEHALLLQYPPGAAIGWHKDKPQFGKIVGISLSSPCIFRFRRKRVARWERCSIVTEARSAYVLDGPARTDWEHSIPSVAELRYSITFRTLAR